MSNRAELLHRKQWGLFFHFLGRHGQSSLQYNKQVDAFDIKLVAEQIAEIGPGYFFLTLGQNSGHFCAPNQTYDEIVGRKPSFCSQRDLPGELAAELLRYDIPLFLYLPSHAPMHDLQAAEALRCIPPWDFQLWSPLEYDDLRKKGTADTRLTEFQKHWEAIIREWSLRWEEKVNGWWFDGGYYWNKMYQSPETPNFSSFAAAARSGNPNAIFTLNTTPPPLQVMSREMDYTAGEIQRNSWMVNCMGSQVPGDAQFHVLTFAGTSWGPAGKRIIKTAREMESISRAILSPGGCITWDVPFSLENGTMFKPDFEIMKQLGRALKNFSRPAADDPQRPPAIRFRISKAPLRLPDNTVKGGECELTLSSYGSAPQECHLDTDMGSSSFPLQYDGCRMHFPLAGSQDTGTEQVFSLTANGEWRFWKYHTKNIAEDVDFAREYPFFSDSGKDIDLGGVRFSPENGALVCRVRIGEETPVSNGLFWKSSSVHFCFSSLTEYAAEIDALNRYVLLLADRQVLHYRDNILTVCRDLSFQFENGYATFSFPGEYAQEIAGADGKLAVSAMIVGHFDGAINNGYLFSRSTPFLSDGAHGVINLETTAIDHANHKIKEQSL